MLIAKEMTKMRVIVYLKIYVIRYFYDVKYLKILYIFLMYLICIRKCPRTHTDTYTRTRTRTHTIHVFYYKEILKYSTK